MLRLEEPDTKFIYVGDSEESYHNLQKRLWAEQEQFIIVEHDIVVWPTAIKQIWDCSYWLCAYQAPAGPSPDGYSLGLGCLKYSSALMKAFPNHMDEVEEKYRSWKNNDWALTWRLLEHKGVGIHFHEPPVIHLSSSRFEMANMISKEG
jgi:hypothetical protein